jgi:hypothetical protein
VKTKFRSFSSRKDGNRMNAEGVATMVAVRQAPAPLQGLTKERRRADAAVCSEATSYRGLFSSLWRGPRGLTEPRSSIAV